MRKFNEEIAVAVDGLTRSPGISGSPSLHRLGSIVRRGVQTILHTHFVRAAFPSLYHMK
jgi:hypothetical protein